MRRLFEHLIEVASDFILTLNLHLVRLGASRTRFSCVRPRVVDLQLGRTHGVSNSDRDGAEAPHLAEQDFQVGQLSDHVKRLCLKGRRLRYWPVRRLSFSANHNPSARSTMISCVVLWASASWRTRWARPAGRRIVTFVSTGATMPAFCQSCRELFFGNRAKPCQ